MKIRSKHRGYVINVSYVWVCRQESPRETDAQYVVCEAGRDLRAVSICISVHLP
jgi:hypothetical protein